MPIRPSTVGGPQTRITEKTHTSGSADSERSAGRDVAVPGARDGFEGQSIDPALDAALKRFADRTRSILGHDAMGLARRSAGLESRESEPTSAQRDALNSAALDLVKELPVRSLSPRLADQLKTEMQRRQLSVDGIENQTLGDLGAAGEQIAKAALRQFKSDHPKSYYGLAAGVALGGAAYAFDRGSDALSKLGIKPELSKSFGSRSKLDVKAGWTKRFSEYQASADLSHRLGGKSPNTTLTAGVSAGDQGHGLDLTALRLGLTHSDSVGDGWRSNSKAVISAKGAGSGLELDRIGLSHRLSKPGVSLTNRLDLDRNGVKSGRTMLSLRDEHNGLTTLRADFGRDLEVNRLSAGYALKTDYAKGRLYAEGRAGYDLRHDRFDASLSAGYQRNDLDIAVVAGRNETQGNFVGVGFKWGF